MLGRSPRRPQDHRAPALASGKPRHINVCLASSPPRGLHRLSVSRGSQSASRVTDRLAREHVLQNLGVMLGTLITIRDGFQGNLRNWTNSSNDLRRLSYTPAVVARTGLLGHYPHRAKFSYLCGAFEGVPPTLQLLGAAPGQQHHWPRADILVRSTLDTVAKLICQSPATNFSEHD
jgi:hypothetical protein